MDQVSIAWAAGLFEGEGTLSRRPVHRRVYLQFGIEMRDLDVVERFVAILRENDVAGRSRILRRKKSHRNPNANDTYAWSITGHGAARCYLLLRPYLGERRRAKADAILAENEEIRAELEAPRVCPNCGESFVMAPYSKKTYCSRRCYEQVRAKRPERMAANRERNRRWHARKKAERAATLDVEEA